MHSGEQMICPFCGGEMTAGRILGLKTSLEWLSADKKLTPFFGTSKYAVRLDEGGVGWGRPKLDAHVCMSCKKLVADLQPYLTE